MTDDVVWCHYYKDGSRAIHIHAINTDIACCTPGSRVVESIGIERELYMRYLATKAEWARIQFELNLYDPTQRGL